jgi:hypothetical protein
LMWKRERAHVMLYRVNLVDGDVNQLVDALAIPGNRRESITNGVFLSA